MSKHVTRGLLIAAAIGLWLISNTARPAAQISPACGVDLRVLVLSADGSEADLPAIRTALDYLGTPYDVYVATAHPAGLDAATLADGCHGKYQGVILTTDNLAYAGPSGFTAALTSADAATLSAYETSFSVRQVTWYTFPTPALGFNYPSSASGDPIDATATARGAQVFPYLKAGVAIPIQFSWTYLTTPADAATTPLLTDAAGHALAAIHVYPDGRENLAMTFDSNPYMTHAMLLSYGIVNWVTRGLFVGDRHVYVSPQVDDIFIDDAQWLTTTACGTSVDNTEHQQRITGADFAAVADWQTELRKHPQTSDLRVTMAFNGVGTTAGYSAVVGQSDTLIVGGSTTGPSADTLTPSARALQQQFFWVSHTYNHTNLDEVPVAAAVSEIQQNNAAAVALGLANYSLHALVQPDVSGLGNPGFLQAASANGLRYLLSDTSKPGQDNPSPNVGFWTASQPDIFVIPRRANNLFFNVATPADWVAEYNCHYNAYWGRDLSYAEVLDQESGQLLAHLLRGELDPWMFHQTNLADYHDGHSLLGDLIDATLAKFSAYSNLPIISPSMEAVGTRMAARTTMRTAGITATLQPGVGLVLLSPVDVTVPITGLQLPGAEFYGGQWISSVAVPANTPTIAAYSVVETPSVSAGAALGVTSASAVHLTGAALDTNSPARPLTFAWMQTGGPSVTLAGASTLTPSFTAPTLATDAAPVTLTFSLIADNGSASASASTTVTVNPTPNPPTADAGAAKTVASGAAVTLAGVGVDLNTPARPLTFAWTQTSGPAVSLTNANAASPAFIAPSPAVGSAPVVLGFTLTVDNGALSASSITTVTVNSTIGAPVVTVGPPQIVDSGATVALGGTATDPNNPLRALTYAWTQTGAPTVALAGATSLNATFTAPVLTSASPALTLSFTLSADNGALSAGATTTVVVRPPVAALAAAQTITADGVGSQTVAPFAVGGGDLLVAFVSSDGPSGAPQTVTVSGAGLTWTNVQRSNTQQGTSEIWTATAPAAIPDATVTADQTAAADPASPFYQSLTIMTFPNARGVGAFAGAGATGGAAAVSLTTTSSGSLIYAIGNDIGLTTPRGVPAGQVVYRETAGSAGDSHWVQGFSAGPVPIAGATVSLGEDDTATSVWNLAAVEIINRNAPVASAGVPQTAGSGQVVHLTGAASDSAVPPRTLTYAWSQTSGPAVSLTGAATLTPSFVAPVLPVGGNSATVGFALSVNNGALVTLATTSVEITPIVGVPSVLAGATQAVPSGTIVGLTGSAADPNLPPRPLTYAWIQTSGPAVAIVDADKPVASFTAPSLTVGMPPATLGFSLTASNGTLAGTAATIVEVDPPIGAPTVTPGVTQNVAGGISVTLAAAVTDPNLPARALTYLWSQTSGPAVTILNAAAATTSFAAPALAIGASPVTLTFSLTVDNGVYNATGVATIVVQPPAALAIGQTVSSDGTGTRTTAAFAVNTGDLVVALVSAQGTSSGTQTATVSGAGLSWTLARRANAQRGTSEVWWAWATGANSAATVSATLASSSNPASLTVMTVAGSDGIGASVAAGATTGAPTVSLTTTQPRSLVFGVGNDGTAARARTAAAGQNLTHEFLGSADSHWVQTLTAGAVAAAGTSVQLRDTAPTADRWNFAAVEILASRAPAITAVKATTTGTAAVVSWTTNVPSGSRVDFGSSPDSLTVGVTDAAMVTAHAVSLRGLTPGATYYYRVTSVNATWLPSTAPLPPAAPLSFAAVNPAGLVAAYGFSEATGTAVNDLTGNGNGGAVSGATWNTAGRYGQALTFNGTSDWITIPDSPSLDLTTGMTVEAWVNPASLTGWQSVLYKERPAPTDAGMAWALYASDSNAPPAIYGMVAGATGNGLWTHATGTAMLPLNTWSHLAATYDGAALRLYVNGTLVRTFTLPGSLSVTPGPLRIGGNSPSIPYGGQFFKGAIDEIRIYNRALSQADIQADMTTRLP